MLVRMFQVILLPCSSNGTCINCTVLMIQILVYNFSVLCEMSTSNIVNFNLPRQLFFRMVLKAEIYFV
jgi:hypothetical protein